MDKAIRVVILGREYPLRVQEDTEESTRAAAAIVDARMQAFRQGHPAQSDVVTAVVAALSLADDLQAARRRQHELASKVDLELQRLDRELEMALAAE